MQFIARLLLVLTVALHAVGCAKMKPAQRTSAPMMPPIPVAEDAVAGITGDASAQALGGESAPSLMPDAVVAERKLIWTGSLTVEVTAVSNAVAAAGVIVKTAGGFVADSQVSEDDATLGLRVPPARLDGVMQQLSTLGSVQVSRVSSQDVTMQFVDTEARLRATKQLRDRLGELVKVATNVTEVLGVERELARVQADIEAMESQLRSLGRQSELATVTCTFNRRTEPVKEARRIYGPLGLIIKGVSWFVEKLFIIQ